MFNIYAFLISLVILAPSLLHAAMLGIPSPGTTLSGVGVISGWKCQADGDLTVVFNDDGKHIPLLYGSERTDVRANGKCLENDHDNVGFVAIWNWSNLDAGGHTAVAYDSGVEFARNTFTVVRASEDEDFLLDVTAECSVSDFPYAGTNARFEWNTGTQHLELAEVGEDVEVPVSTRFDGVWDITFYETGHPLGSAAVVCGSAGVNQRSSGTFEVRDGRVVGADISIAGDTTSGLEWYGTITPGGGLEGSWIFPREDDWLTIGSWDGVFFSDEAGTGNWFHVCGLYGHWEAERRADS